MNVRKFKRLVKKSLDITFEDIVNTPPEKQEAVDELMDRALKKSCEEQNKLLRGSNGKNH